MITLDEGSVSQPPASPANRQPGQEPLAGYRLLEPLGQGGFGEVWKCAVSGGLVKAIKFVEGAGPGSTTSSSTQANIPLTAGAQELSALQQVKTIRHPFLLSIERIEIVGGTLLIVMELADRNLQAVLLEYQIAGQPGIPREQLVGFLFEAAEALDELNFKHGLQHLDVKPHNLFVIGNHVKVGDFGLVRSLSSSRRAGGLTPLYAAPEQYQQSFSRHSDQYSLAIVYQQLLSSTVPFSSPEPEQLRQQHLTGTPDLAALPEADRPVVARALAKDPEKRYPSCQAFVRTLLEAGMAGMPPALRRSALIQRVRQTLSQPDRSGRTAASPAAPQTFPERPARPAGAGADPLGGATTPWIARSHLRDSIEMLPGAEAARNDSSGASRPDLPEDVTPLPRRVGSLAPQALQKTCVQLAGCRFLECRGQNPLGEVWMIEDSKGRQRLGYCLIPTPEASSRALTRLQARNHPALPSADIFWSPAGRMVLVTDPGRKTLRDVLEESQKDSQAGIPRQQLLTWLGSAAEALDELADSEGLSHLGLNPINLLIEGDRLLLADFALIPLVWLPTGQPPAVLNPRYAAPELGGTKVSGPASDQYSLALIYAEMLTGIYPRLNVPGSRSGSHRRQAIHPAGPGGGGPKPQVRMLKALDLDFLPVADREIISRALHEDPAQRYPSCTALVEALERMTVAGEPDPDHSFATLPLVLPVECLLGKPFPPRKVMPLAGQVVAQLISTVSGSVTDLGFDNLRCWQYPDGSWESRLPVQILAGLLRYKLEGFRQHWKAEKVSEGDSAFVCRIVTHTAARGVWPFRKAEPAGLEIAIQLADGHVSHKRSEVIIHIRPFGDESLDSEQRRCDMVPRLFQSLRAFLQANTEQRAQQRWPLALPLRVYPILPNLEAAGVLEAQTRNISQGGLSFLTNEELASDHLYLHFYQSPQLASLAILARALRLQPLENGRFEVGVTFTVDGPPGN